MSSASAALPNIRYAMPNNRRRRPSNWAAASSRSGDDPGRSTAIHVTLPPPASLALDLLEHLSRLRLAVEDRHQDIAVDGDRAVNRPAMVIRHHDLVCDHRMFLHQQLEELRLLL